MNIIKKILSLAILALLLIYGAKFFIFKNHENAVLKKIIARLEADSRIAEVLVTSVQYDEQLQKKVTTIKFLEYDVQGKPLAPKYYSFSGNIIQFQSLVVRFDEKHVRKADPLKGRSAYLFWKVFLLNGKETQEFEITKINEIPRGYKLENSEDPIEGEFWNKFWKYALDPGYAHKDGIKNAQIEAPGSMFIPGHLYTIFIEHDGGLRIDASPISPILRGESIP